MSRFRWILAFSAMLAALFLAVHLFGAKTDLEMQRSQIEVSWLKVEQGLERRAATVARLVDLLEARERRPALGPWAKQVSKMTEGLRQLHEAETVAKKVEAHSRLERTIQVFRESASGVLLARNDKDLQRVLDESLAIENRIHQDRTEYNEAVLRYNVQLAMFPGNLAGRVFRLHRHDLYLPTELRVQPEQARR